jgi:hypothetical protein
MEGERTVSSDSVLPPQAIAAPSTQLAGRQGSEPLQSGSRKQANANLDQQSNEGLPSDRMHLSIRLVENQIKKDSTNPPSVEVVVISSGRLPVPPLSGRERQPTQPAPAAAVPPQNSGRESEAAPSPVKSAPPVVVQPAAPLNPIPPPAQSSSVSMPPYLRQFVADVLSPRSVDNLFRLSMEDRLSALNVLYKAYEESCKKFQFS